MCQWNSTPFTMANIKTTTKLIARLINAEMVAEITIMYFGKFIFLIKSPLLTIADMPWDVASEKNDHSVIAKSNDTAKWGMPAPNLKKWTNTIYIMANSNRGLKTDHSTPKTEPWYRSLKSVLTSSFSKIVFCRLNTFGIFISIYCTINTANTKAEILTKNSYAPWWCIMFITNLWRFLIFN